MLFKYSALNKSGTSEEGKLNAPSYLEAIALLHQKGLLPVEVRGGKIKASDMFVYDQILVFKNLSVLLIAGVSLTQALKLISEQSRNAKLKAILEDVLKRVEAGSGLPEVLTNHPDTFSMVLIGMLDSSNLPRSLDRAALYLNEEQEQRAKERARLTYPIILFVIFIIGIIVSSLILSGRL
jgi:type IV pilus assembly protein PilC